MMPAFRLTLACFVTVVAPLSRAFAGDSSLGVDLAEILLPPPARSSQAERDDLDGIVAIQRTVEAKRLARARADANETVEQLFAELLGIDFNDEKAPLTFALLREAQLEMAKVVGVAKINWERPRPHTIDRRIELKVTTPIFYAYPSGAATLAYETACLLSYMVPERLATLMRRAAEFGESRIVVGAHYPTDVLAGQIAGTALAAAFLKSKSVRDRFDAAKPELRKAIGQPSGLAE